MQAPAVDPRRQEIAHCATLRARRLRRAAGTPTAALAAVLAAAIAIVTGCAAVSKPANDESVSMASSCVSLGVTPKAVQLGLITPVGGMSGAAYLTYRSGVDARIGVENAHGGVNGRMIAYKWRDDESNMATNLAVARQLVREGVFGVIQGSTASAGSADYLRDQGVPVTGTATDPSWSSHENMISYSNLVGGGPSISTWGDFVREKGGKRAAVLSIQNLPWSAQLAARIKTSLVESDVQTPVSTPISVIEPDLDAVVADMTKFDVDTIVAVLDDTLLPAVVEKAQAAELNLRVVLSPNAYDPSLIHAHGHALAGSYSFLTVQPFEANLPAHQAFLTAMAMYAPQVQPSAQQVALTGWIDADLFIRALHVAPGCPTRETALKGLRSIHDYNAGGLLLRPVNLAATPSRPDTCFAFVQVNADGAGFTPVQPIPRCGDLLGR